MNIKTNSIEDYVEFVEITTKQNKWFIIFIFLVVVITSLFLVFLLFVYINEQQFLFTRKI